jgi:exonuclease III
MCRKGRRLIQSRLKQLTSEKRFVILLGDFNIFATDQDLYSPTANMWYEYCMKTAKERNALELLLSLGYTDLYAFYYPLSQFCSFTRLQQYSTQQDQKNGYRIDLIILPTSSLPYVTDTTVVSVTYGRLDVGICCVHSAHSISGFTG